ncbi:MAG: hypothetical protein JXR37_31565 [Kiritimatiellae bacterium]|nr:hypothetical protein [Kiritimatiellia bacterium]
MPRTLVLATLLTLPVLAAPPAQAMQELTVELKVPDSAWTVEIKEVFRVGDELWVISKVERDARAVGAAVITTISSTLNVRASGLPVKHFVLGKTWSWENAEPYTFLKDREALDKQLEKASPLYMKGDAGTVPAPAPASRPRQPPPKPRPLNLTGVWKTANGDQTAYMRQLGIDLYVLIEDGRSRAIAVATVIGHTISIACLSDVPTSGTRNYTNKGEGSVSLDGTAVSWSDGPLDGKVWKKTADW